VRRIDFARPGEQAIHDRLVRLAGRLLRLSQSQHARDPGARRPDHRREAIEREIDSLVYERYGLDRQESDAVDAEIERLQEEAMRPRTA